MLEAASEYIAVDSPAAAHQLAVDVVAGAESLSDFSERGRIVPELSEANPNTENCSLAPTGSCTSSMTNMLLSWLSYTGHAIFARGGNGSGYRDAPTKTHKIAPPDCSGGAEGGGGGTTESAELLFAPALPLLELRTLLGRENVEECCVLLLFGSLELWT